MARQRRGGGLRPPELRGTLGTLLRTTLAQAGVVRDAIERGAREGRSRLDDLRSNRRRHDALAELGDLVLDLIRRGEIDLAELPRSRRGRRSASTSSTAPSPRPNRAKSRHLPGRANGSMAAAIAMTAPSPRRAGARRPRSANPPGSGVRWPIRRPSRQRRASGPNARPSRPSPIFRSAPAPAAAASASTTMTSRATCIPTTSSRAPTTSLDSDRPRPLEPARPGDLAQLGERVNGIHEVRGSIPLISTTKGLLRQPFFVPFRYD